jgi:hypothetical protein
VGWFSKQKKAVLLLLVVLVLGGIFVTKTLRKSDSELLAECDSVTKSAQSIYTHEGAKKAYESLAVVKNDCNLNNHFSSSVRADKNVIIERYNILYAQVAYASNNLAVAKVYASLAVVSYNKLSSSDRNTFLSGPFSIYPVLSINDNLNPSRVNPKPLVVTKPND